MKIFPSGKLAVAVCALAFCVRVVAGQAEVLADVDRLELKGQFNEAAAVLEKELAIPALDSADRKVLEFERERLERIRKDFPLTREVLFAELQKAIKGVTLAEFEKWIAEGRFDSRLIDGTTRFMVSSVSNLFWRYPELNRRRVPLKITTPLERRILETCESIETATRSAKTAYVLPKQFEVTMVVTAKPGAAPEGEVVRAWLPIPRDYPFQEGFHLVSASPAVIQTSGPGDTIRSVYLEQPARKDQPSRFEINYVYRAYGVRFQVDPATVRNEEASTKPELRHYLTEGPHIQFTAEMRQLSNRIAGSETNAFLKAKKFYDWIAENIKYSFAIEYSTIRNIGEYCRSRGYGDCGQQALLFMTLCRMNGIPARWQSGWNTFPGGKSIHDWCDIYIAPYGWIPVDPYMGVFAMRYATALRPEQRLKVRDFYFGGLDQYRIIANSDHNQELSPAKQSMRSDTVDFQRGELEWGNQNIYFNEFSYELTVKELKAVPGKFE